jgi:hypothetical protein
MFACVTMASIQTLPSCLSTTFTNEYCRPSFKGTTWISTGPISQRVAKVRDAWIGCGWLRPGVDVKKCVEALRRMVVR